MAIEWGRGILEAGGKRLEYAGFGPTPRGAQAVIVLLHEGLGCVALWRDFPARLAAATGCPVFAYSRAGYGQSEPVSLPRPLDYMTREAVEVLPQVLDALGAGRVVLCGHSDGATIAAIYAGSVEDFRLRGLMLMAPHFFTEPGGLASIREAREAYANTDLRTKMARYHADPDNAFLGWNGAWLDPGFEAWNVAEVIDCIRVPTLALQGVEDQYGTHEQVNVIERRSYAPVEVVMLEACRHSPHLEQPEATLAAMAEFMARLERIERVKVAVR